MELANGDILAVYYCPFCGGAYPESDDPNPDPVFRPTSQLHSNRAIDLTRADAEIAIGSLEGYGVVVSHKIDGVHVTYEPRKGATSRTSAHYVVDTEEMKVLSRGVSDD